MEKELNEFVRTNSWGFHWLKTGRQKFLSQCDLLFVVLAGFRKGSDLGDENLHSVRRGCCHCDGHCCGFHLWPVVLVLRPGVRHSLPTTGAGGVHKLHKHLRSADWLYSWLGLQVDWR